MFEYKVRRVGSVTVLDLSGRVSLAEAIAAGTEQSLGEIIHRLVHDGANNILVNLEKVPYIDSSGMGDLFGALTLMQSHGGQLRLLKPNSAVREVLNLTRLDAVLPVDDDEAGAIKSFARTPTSG